MGEINSLDTELVTSHCCDQIPHQRNLRKGEFYFGSQPDPKVYHREETTGTGSFMIAEVWTRSREQTESRTEIHKFKSQPARFRLLKFPSLSEQCHLWRRSVQTQEPLGDASHSTTLQQQMLTDTDKSWAGDPKRIISAALSINMLLQIVAIPAFPVAVFKKKKTKNSSRQLKEWCRPLLGWAFLYQLT